MKRVLRLRAWLLRLGGEDLSSIAPMLRTCMPRLRPLRVR